MSEYVKCYAGNLDGQREGLIVTTSKKRAAEIARTSLHSFNQYWSQQPFPDQQITPHTLYTRPFMSRGNPPPWVAGRCEVKRYEAAEAGHP